MICMSHLACRLRDGKGEKGCAQANPFRSNTASHSKSHHAYRQASGQGGKGDTGGGGRRRPKMMCPQATGTSRVLAKQAPARGWKSKKAGKIDGPR